MKKSEQIKAEMDRLEAEYHEKAKAEAPATAEDYDYLWRKFYTSYGKDALDRLHKLEFEHLKELNREIEVGDGVTMCLWSDRHAFTVIARTKATLTIQRDKAILDPSFKPEYVPGGFACHCTNSDEQSYTYERDPNGEIEKCRWSEKRGRWQTGSDGSICIIRGRHEHYDYNF